MAPTPTTTQPQRTTRPSTRSQTLESHRDARTRDVSPRTKSTGRIAKQRPKAPRPTKQSTSKYDAARANKPSDPAKSPPTSPDNVKVFTIEDPLLTTPLVCHEYAPTAPAHNAVPHVIFTHGAGGTLYAPAVVNFSRGFSSVATSSLFAFQGSPNLRARVKAFQSCWKSVRGDDVGVRAATRGRVVFGGQSMGARAAAQAVVEVAAEARDGNESFGAGLLLVSYPLKGPKDVRDRVLIDLPTGVEVLFVVGDRDAMCPLGLLEETRAKMNVKSRVVVVRGADHGMNIRPASKTKEIGEESGSVAARWLSGDVECEGETLYLGE